MSLAATKDNQGPYDATVTSSDDLIYQSVSRSAVAALVLAVLGLLSIIFVWLIILPIVACAMAAVAIVSIRKYPNELLGKPMATSGLVLGLLTLIVAPAYHTYVYMTEVPPGYERIAFATLMSPTGAADVPPAAAMELDGMQVFVKGYIHPTSMDSPLAKKFVLVPDLGTCCFGGQPPLTHMIEVTLTGDQMAHKGLRKQKLAGTLRVNRALKPVDGLEGVYYTLMADYIH